MRYPGHVIRVEETNAAIVKALKERLNLRLVLTGEDRLDPDNPAYGPRMAAAVRLFQAQNVDHAGRTLKQDGEVGPLTWDALFPESRIRRAPALPADSLRGAVLLTAHGEWERKVREEPRNSNRGPDVEKYLRSVGLPGGHAWCCAFVHWCFEQASRQLGRPRTPMVRTAGCLDHWRRATSEGGARRVRAATALDDPTVLLPGMVFIMDHGAGRGHTGLIESVDGGWLHTIEGNTDTSGGREGGGVYKLQRKLAEINTGYILYD